MLVRLCPVAVEMSTTGAARAAGTVVAILPVLGMCAAYRIGESVPRKAHDGIFT